MKEAPKKFSSIGAMSKKTTTVSLRNTDAIEECDAVDDSDEVENNDSMDDSDAVEDSLIFSKKYTHCQDLARELVTRRPQDHILFLKHKLARLKRSRDKPKIIILAPPHVDMERLTEMVSDCMGVDTGDERRYKICGFQ
ncbi:unnamed protein product, partial [Timema podura]|nr:unnamed protein product [Timema podura]